MTLVIFRGIGLCLGQRLRLFERYYRSTLTSGLNIQCKPGLQFNTSSISEKEYTREQQNQILEVLNESTPEELSRFAVSKRRAILLSSFRTENGRFQNLEQVLRVRTFGEQMLTRLCDSVLDGDCQHSGGEVGRPVKSRVQLVVPALEESRRDKLASAIGIYVGLNVISWANIDRFSNVLTDWGLFHVDADSKKVHPTTVLETVFEARMEIPDGDVYVMEDSLPPGHSATQQVMSLSIQLHKSQLAAILLAMLNTTAKSLDNVGGPHENRHRVFYLRSRSTARLFGTLIGSERVSAQTVVRQVMEPGGRDTDYSPVVIGDALKSYYLSKSSVDRENLSQSLLLTMAFMDLVIFQTPRSIKVVTGR